MRDATMETGGEIYINLTFIERPPYVLELILTRAGDCDRWESAC